MNVTMLGLAPAFLLLTTSLTVAALAGWVGSAHRLRIHRAQLEHAERDGLTGLWRREAFERRAGAALTTGNIVGLLDLDGFKPINDRHGHAAGDAVLRVIAQRLQAELGQTTQIARLGGDEFAFIARLAPGQASWQLDKLTAALAAPIPIPDVGELVVGISLGVTWLVDLPSAGDADPASVLAEALSAADIAMYEAKTMHHDWRLYNPLLDARRPASQINPAPVRRYREHDLAALSQLTALSSETSP